MTAAGRRWLELSARAPGAGEERALLADALVALGGRAIEERDGWYVTHLDETGEAEVLRTRAEEELLRGTGLRRIETRASWCEHEAWEETWKRGLGVRRVTERLVVRPSWLEHEDPRPGDLVMILDPGMAFGTAEHGTTRGCLRLLEGAVAEGARVLDVGAGSGILSVAAALLGARVVVALEGDPLACEALSGNVERNRVADRVVVECRWVDATFLLGAGPADLVVANIEAGILAPLLPGLAEATLPGGHLLLSGILADEWEGFVPGVEAAGLDLEAVDRDEGWVSGLFTRPG